MKLYKHNKTTHNDHYMYIDFIKGKKFGNYFYPDYITFYFPCDGIFNKKENSQYYFKNMRKFIGVEKNLSSFLKDLKLAIQQGIK